jgi:hypothetical protein
MQRYRIASRWPLYWISVFLFVFGLVLCYLAELRIGSFMPLLGLLLVASLNLKLRRVEADEQRNRSDPRPESVAAQRPSNNSEMAPSVI